MDLDKIGKFIALSRKNKRLTQEQLAEKLGVTNKTISRWETGKYMPDLSLLKPLSDELGITLNELLSGEKLEKEKILEKTEKSLISTIDYTNKKIKKTTTIFISILTIIIILITIVVSLYVIDMNRMRNNKPIFFSTWGYSYAPPIDMEPTKIEIAIKDYLVKKGDSEPKKNDNEKTFVSMKIYLIEEKDNYSIYNIYAWVLQEKYYLKNNEIKQDSGSSIPYMFIVEKKDDKYSVKDSRVPRDGSYYEDDMKNIFPADVRNEMEQNELDGTIEQLKLEIQEQVKLYFHE